VQVTVSTTHLRAGGTLRIAGVTTPPKGHVLVLIARRTRGGAYGRPTAIAAATTGGRFALSTPLARPGLYRVLVTTRADALNEAGSSRAAFVRVR
jgi:hypothetical protein